MHRITDKEFVRRIVWLAHKFPDYKIKTSSYYQTDNEVKKELELLKEPYETYHGTYYNTYAEDCCDECIILNPDKINMIYFETEISDKSFGDNTVYCINNNIDLLNHIISKRESLEFLNTVKNPKSLFKEIIDNIFDQNKPINIKKINRKKRQYSQIEKDDDYESIEHVITVETTKTKKIKI